MEKKLIGEDSAVQAIKQKCISGGMENANE